MRATQTAQYGLRSQITVNQDDGGMLDARATSGVLVVSIVA